ncbi:MAG: co-chaperone DjlA [Desulfobacterales bacterium]|jgi:DnaJ like chaperone protein|nr:co-chaperone DjlA [Desulfobacteraceae bacterium]MBT7087083.1 co-chaperone DjlA [Desulfobacterales bacterium]
MGWFGKLVGGSIGLALGGPLGAIIGASLGHSFDKNGERYISGETRQGYIQPVGSRLSSQEQSQLTFFVAAFSMLGKLSKADGRVCEKEIDSIQKFMLEDLNLDPEGRQVAINIFNEATRSSESFSSFARQFYAQFRTQYNMLELMTDILLRVSVADGSLNENEEELILSAVGIFNFSDQEYKKLKSRYVNDVEKYYSILGSSKSDSNENIKKNYRKLVLEYHPDTIISKGLPDEFIKFANDKFREIQEAYETVRKERGF